MVYSSKLSRSTVKAKVINMKYPVVDLGDTGTNLFHFREVFRRIGKIIGWHPPLWEILDQPLVQSKIVVQSLQNELGTIKSEAFCIFHKDQFFSKVLKLLNLNRIF